MGLDTLVEATEPVEDTVVKSMTSLQLSKVEVTAVDAERMLLNELLNEKSVKKPDYLECPFNWIQFLKSGIHIGNPSTKKYILEWLDVHDKKLQYVLRTIPIEYFLKKTLQAIFKATDENAGPKECCLLLDELVKLAMGLDDTRFSKEYKEGLINLIVCTKKEVKRHFGVTTGLQRFKTLPPRKLDELSAAAKCPILAAKVYFCRIVKGSMAYQERIAKQILAYEKDRAEWHHLHYLVLRAIRHQDEVRFRFRPDAYELQALSQAYSLDGENMEVLVSVWKTLFDCQKQRRDVYIQIGCLEFSCREAVSEFLGTSILTAVEEGKDYSVRLLLAAAQIIGHHRIGPKRDKELAETLLNKALEEWTTFSKTLNRIGNLHMFEKRDIEAAKASYLLAITEDPSDAVSTLNYLWIDSAKGKAENILEIEKKLASKGSSQWPDHVRLDLSFLKGLIYFSVGKTKEALTEWTKAQELSYQYFMTKLYSLDSCLKRFSWKIKIEGVEDRMTSEFIEECVKNFTDELSSNDDADDKGFFRLIEILKTVKQARTRPPQEYQDQAGSKPPREYQDHVGPRYPRQDQDQEGTRRPRQDKDQAGGRRPWNDKDQAGGRRPREDQEQSGPRRPRQNQDPDKKQDWRKSDARKEEDSAAGPDESDWRS